MPKSDLKKTIAELKKLGSAQTKKIYLRHGATEPLFGVKFGDLTKLKKKLGTDHSLACALWDTGNSDAMTLALMIADPSEMKSGDIDNWLKPLEYNLLIGMLCEVVAQTKFAATKWKKWSAAKSEQKLIAAYDLLSHWLKDSPDEVPSGVISDALKKISSSIHDSPNMARHSMNNAVIAIGVFNASRRKDAIATAKAVGKIEVDHGETSCKTPDAVSYIDKAVKHNRKRKRC